MALVDIYSTDKKYQVIYADPPWTYNTWSEKGKESRSAEKHYNCMTKEDIQNLPVKELSAGNRALFLWVTFPCLQEGLELIEKWGFTYKTCAFSWVKRNRNSDSFFMGCGYWTRANTEICLLATKGKPHRVSKSVRQICDAPIMEHSRKPAEIRDRIVELCGDVPRIELFARQVADGWDRWGNEAPEDEAKEGDTDDNIQKKQDRKSGLFQAAL